MREYVQVQRRPTTIIMDIYCIYIEKKEEKKKEKGKLEVWNKRRTLKTFLKAWYWIPCQQIPILFSKFNHPLKPKSLIILLKAKSSPKNPLIDKFLIILPKRSLYSSSVRVPSSILVSLSLIRCYTVRFAPSPSLYDSLSFLFFSSAFLYLFNCF